MVPVIAMSLRRSDHWHRMASGGQRLYHADADQPQQARDENIRGQQKHASALGNPTQINDGDEQQNSQTEPQRLRLQRRHGGNQRADASRNSHCGGEHIIDHQRSGRQQSGVGAEVLAGNGVRASALRIRGDRLPVREVHDAEQHHDAQSDRPDIDRRPPCPAESATSARLPVRKQPNSAHRARKSECLSAAQFVQLFLLLWPADGRTAHRRSSREPFGAEFSCNWRPPYLKVPHSINADLDDVL